MLSVPSGRVSIGFPVALASLLGCELFVRLRSAYPQILLHLIDGNSGLLRERLNNGRLDLAVLLIEQPERGLAVEPLVLEELFYVTADQDRSPSHRRCGTTAAAGARSRQRHPARRPQDVRETRPAARPDRRNRRLLNMLRQLVASGVGNSIMTWSGLHSGDQPIALNYRRFVDAKMDRPVSLCFSEVALRSPAVEAVALTLKLLVRELVEGGTWQGVTLIMPAAEPSGSPARHGEPKLGELKLGEAKPHTAGRCAVLRRLRTEK